MHIRVFRTKQAASQHLRRSCYGLLLVASLGHAQGAADVDAVRITGAGREGANWVSHGRTYAEERFSPLARINEHSVSDLGLAWTYKIEPDRGLEATPIVVDGVMYATGPFSIVYALDARSGKLIWQYDPQVDRSIADRGCCGPVNRGVAVWKGKVFVGAFDGRLIAIDAATGKPVWSTDTFIDHSRNYTITGAPRVVNGRVLIGNGGAEYGVRGYVSAYDSESGALAWRFYTVPGDPAKPPENAAMAMARRTWYGNRYGEQGGGGTVWDSMSYDPELNLLYIGVGNGSTWDRKLRSEGKGDNLFIASIVALNADTGKYVWHYQTSPGEMWDHTATQQMVLADLMIQGQTRKVLMQAPKNGFFYVLDRRTGQFISANNYVPVNWTKGIDPKTGRPVPNPEQADYSSGELKVVSPSGFGGHNWQSMAYSPITRLVYIPAMEVAWYFKGGIDTPMPKELGTFHFGPMVGLALTRDAAAPARTLKLTDMPDPSKDEDARRLRDSWKGRLVAWDPVTQQEAWHQDHRSIWNGGTLATAGGLVFQGTGDGQFIAYQARTGEPLWTVQLDNAVMAAPISYEVDGEQYIAVMAGAGGGMRLTTALMTAGDNVSTQGRLLAFKIGGQAKLPDKVPTVSGPPPPTPALTAEPSALQQGYVLYQTHCAACHGLNAIGGGVVPDLRYLTSDKHDFFTAIVGGALAPLGMPNFSRKLQPEQIELIHQYVIERSQELSARLRNISPGAQQ
ncbi:PQQ-dependent dehydrogenase, methanol/ethanol family [Pseudomonas bohemica]|uniref:PQQ-dependent dehydrogenase, methanol/ethanol family n=1 Tax=Pseudomonas bohemica TaxID=2044872 RepID=UPI0018FE07F2|nr:PQQ-dependent dehydrogenase, methanol/ethanol family [Pseudomonas bohemica]